MTYSTTDVSFLNLISLAYPLGCDALYMCSWPSDGWSFGWKDAKSTWESHLDPCEHSQSEIVWADRVIRPNGIFLTGPHLQRYELPSLLCTFDCNARALCKTGCYGGYIRLRILLSQRHFVVVMLSQ